MKKILMMAAACLMVAAAFAAQCTATTKKGTQCKRQAAAGSLYCWQHGGKTTSQSTVAVPSAQTNSLVQCKAITKAGTQCKRKPSPGSNYCWQHQGNVTEKPALPVETTAQKAPATEAKPPVVAGGTCTATTKDGKRCSRKAKAGSDKCWQHAQ